ncbi:hypothetical protein CEG14_23190 [Bordetella genomosp. 1]|uniref:WG repeat-containing protein n=1 Tax=Bordetella genomosp. 1 TaxID=1395607 RepID=A0A261RVZ8_9BORD|nr:WG repeat-containing protein [Bordetella genomosp. 1]OZI28842.1 hypothetical protein CEG14_23190 [Bordetella genomosp. 1]
MPLPARLARRTRPPLLSACLAFALMAQAHAAPDDAAMDAVGVVADDGSMTTYSDPFCAGYAETFKKQGGDKALVPECPEEPVEPLSDSGITKGERAGAASAKAYLQFKKQQAAALAQRPGAPVLAGFYDKSRDAWVSNEPGIYPINSFDGGRYATISREDVGMGVIDRNGLIVVPLAYPQIGFEQGETFITVRDKADKVGVFDGQGKTLVPARFANVLILDKNYLIGQNPGKNEVFDNTGQVLFTLDRDVVPAGEGLFWFMQEPQRWGLVDARGRTVVKPEFTYTSSFQKGRVSSQKADGENYTIYVNGKVEKQRR